MTPSTRGPWVEIHTFTDRNGPELNDHSVGGVPDGRYVPQAAHLEAVKALREIADEAEACRTREIPMELGWLRRRAERALGERS